MSPAAVEDMDPAYLATAIDLLEEEAEENT